MLRILIGFLVAALWLPLLGLLGFSWEGTFFAGAAALFTVPLTFGFALPIHLLFQYVKVLPSWWACMTIGAVAGAVGALTFGGLSNSLSGWVTLPGFALVGVVSALIFWVIAIRKNSSAIVRYQG